MLFTDSGSARRAAITLVSLVVTLVSLFTIPRFVGPARADTPIDTQFVPVAPSTLLDTRYGTGGVTPGEVPGNGSVTFQVAGQAGIPSTGVAAVALNLTALDVDSMGYFTVFPSDAPTTTATLTYHTGENATGEDFTRLTSTGEVTVVNNGSTPVNIVVTVRGYFLDAASTTAGNEYYPVAATWLYDTRPSNLTGSPAHQAAPVPANSSITFDVAGQAGIPATGVSAVAINVAATAHTAKGWLTVRPSDQPENRLITAVDYVPEESDSSFAVTQLTSTGQLTVTNYGSSSVHVSVSLRGYFLGSAGGDGASYRTVPSKVHLNTLDGTGVPGSSTAPVPSGSSLTFNIIKAAGLENENVSAVALNIFARQPTAQGWLSAYSTVDGETGVNSVNFDEGSESTNGFDVIIPDYEGNVTFTNHSNGTVHLQVSLRGYFVEPDEPADPEIDGLTQLPDSETPAEDPTKVVVAGTPHREFDIGSKSVSAIKPPAASFTGTIWWYGSAPYDVYINANLLDDAADGACATFLANMDGKVVTSDKWIVCQAGHDKQIKGWFQRSITKLTFKACATKHYASGWKYYKCNSNWK